MNALKTTWILIALCAVAIALPGCGSSDEEPAAQAPTRVKILRLPHLSFAPFFIGEEEGYFAEQNLEIEYVKVSQPQDALPALAQGKIDVFCASQDVGILNIIARGAQVKLVADKAHVDPDHCPYLTLVARRELAEQGLLDKPETLRRLRFATRKNDLAACLVDKALARHGLSLDDVEVVVIPTVTREEAVGTGAVDVSTSVEPWTARLMRTGNAVVWVKDTDLMPNWQFAFVAFGPSFLKDHPDVGKRFMVAYLKSVRQYNLGKTERNLAIVAKHTQLDKDLLGECCWPSMRDDGRINVQSVLEFQDWAVTRGLVDEPVTADQIYDSRFVEYAAGVLAGTPARPANP